MNAFHDPVFQAYALAVCALIVTLYFLGFQTARIRAARRIVVNHEDTGVNAGAAVAEVEHADVQRIHRAHRNAIENAVPFFAIGLLYTMTDPGHTFARALFGLFVAVRVFHAAFYLTARQPWRTLTFAIGAVVNLTMVVQVARAAIAAM